MSTRRGCARRGVAWDTLAGQVTDDSEMALTLARARVRDGAHDRDRMLGPYAAWLESPPFDVGGTTRAGIRGTPRLASESNGSLMRVSPLDVWAHALDDADRACPRCGGALEEMSGQYEESEEIDVVERRFVLKPHKRKKYRCGCNACVGTALGPAKLKPGAVLDRLRD